jgi:hypothetical protein
MQNNPDWEIQAKGMQDNLNTTQTRATSPQDNTKLKQCQSDIT